MWVGAGVFPASVVPSPVGAGQHSDEGAEEPSACVWARFCAALLIQVLCATNSSHLGGPSSIVNSAPSTQQESQALFGFPLFVTA